MKRCSTLLITIIIGGSKDKSFTAQLKQTFGTKRMSVAEKDPNFEDKWEAMRRRIHSEEELLERKKMGDEIFEDYKRFARCFFLRDYQECNRIAHARISTVKQGLYRMNKAEYCRARTDTILRLGKMRDTYIEFCDMYDNGMGILADFAILPKNQEEAERIASQNKETMEIARTTPISELAAACEAERIKADEKYKQIIDHAIKSDPESVCRDFEYVKKNYTYLKRMQKKMGNSGTITSEWVDDQIKRHQSSLRYLIPRLPSFKQTLKDEVRKKLEELKEEFWEQDARDIDQLAAECEPDDEPEPQPKAKCKARDKRIRRQQAERAAASSAEKRNEKRDENDVDLDISKTLAEIIQEYWDKFRGKIVSEEVDESAQQTKARIHWSKTLEQFRQLPYPTKSDESFAITPHLIPCAEPYKHPCPISVSYANFSSNDPDPISSEIKELWEEKGVKTVIKDSNHSKEDFALGIAVISSSNKRPGNTLHNVDLTLTNHHYSFKRCAINGLLTLLIDENPDRLSILNYVEYILNAIINNDAPEAEVAKIAYMQKFERKLGVTETMHLITFFKVTVLDLLEDEDDAINAAISYHMPRKDPLTSSLGSFTVCNNLSDVLNPEEEGKLIFIGHSVPSKYIDKIPANDLGLISYDRMQDVFHKLQAQGPHTLISPMEDAFTSANTTAYLDGNIHTKMLQVGQYTLITSWNMSPVDPQYERIESVVLIKNGDGEAFDEWVRTFEEGKIQPTPES